MSKKILEVRFVNFGDECERCAFRVTAFTDGFHHLAETLFSIHSEPQIYGKSFASLRGDVQTWVYNLNNSGDAPVPRIERQKDTEGYRVHTRDTHIHFIIGEESLRALNQIYGKEAPINEPKKYEAKWERIFPRVFELRHTGVNDVTDGDNLKLNFRNGALTALKRINQLQQAESGTLEVWELTVTEESA